MDAPARRVVVVGAGPAGLAVAAEVRRRGLEPVVLERGTAVAERWRTRYDGLRLNTWRGFSHLPGMRLPRSAGRYAPRDAFVAYLEAYARRNALDLRLGVDAVRIDRGWQVVCAEETFAAPHVVVATGWDAEPHMPGWATAAGCLHTSQLRDLGRFAGRRVLVVGAGNSGIDVAGLLVRAGADVTVSMRTPPNVFPRDWLGLPLGPSVLVSERVPSPPVDALGRLIQRQRYGDLSAYGIPRSPQGFMSRFRLTGVNPAVDDGFVAALKAGRARVAGEVVRLEGGDAVLSSGERLEVDDVICATGYRRGLESLVGHLGVLDARGVPLDLNPVPGLYFAGFRQALSGSIRVAARQARQIARAIAADQ